MTSLVSDRVVAWAQQLRHMRAARTVFERFDAAGIVALPVKGIVSAHTLYADLADRLLTDVDLRIRPRDFDRVVALIRQQGWPIVQHMRAYRNVVFMIDGVAMDVEAHAALPGMASLTIDAMIARAEPSNVLGFPHLLPDFHDHAVVLLLNVFKDKLVHAFTWSVRDIERLVESPSFVASTLAARLREASASTAGWAVADWMVVERGVPRWSEVRDALGVIPARPLYIAALRRLRALQPRGALVLRVLSRMSADRPADRVHALACMAWWQTEAWASQWGAAPLRRMDVTQLEGTVFAQKQSKP